MLKCSCNLWLSKKDYRGRKYRGQKGRRPSDLRSCKMSPVTFYSLGQESYLIRIMYCLLEESKSHNSENHKACLVLLLRYLYLCFRHVFVWCSYMLSSEFGRSLPNIVLANCVCSMVGATRFLCKMARMTIQVVL